MNIHLPAILMFTRGTRFWHTAKSLFEFGIDFSICLGDWMAATRGHRGPRPWVCDLGPGDWYLHWSDNFRGSKHFKSISSPTPDFRSTLVLGFIHHVNPRNHPEITRNHAGYTNTMDHIQIWSVSDWPCLTRNDHVPSIFHPFSIHFPFSLLLLLGSLRGFVSQLLQQAAKILQQPWTTIATSIPRVRCPPRRTDVCLKIWAIYGPR